MHFHRVSSYFVVDNVLFVLEGKHKVLKDRPSWPSSCEDTATQNWLIASLCGRGGGISPTATVFGSSNCRQLQLLSEFPCTCHWGSNEPILAEKSSKNVFFILSVLKQYVCFYMKKMLKWRNWLIASASLIAALCHFPKLQCNASGTIFSTAQE